MRYAGSGPMSAPDEDFERQWRAEESPEAEESPGGVRAAPRAAPSLTPQLRQEYERLLC
jgi:hypothetical protein